MQTIYEAVGGHDGLLRLASAWHARALEDDVVSHAFSHGYHPQHTERLAAYWAEALGGPSLYSGAYADETSVVRIHSGNGPHEEMDQRAIACFDQALEDIGLAPEEDLRRALHDYFAWVTTTTMARYQDSAEDVPDGLQIPKWSWHGHMVSVFFYGLFMDESVLASQGVSPSNATVGYVDGYSLRIGRRATLVRDDSQRAYGVLMSVRADHAKALYSAESVADYVPEPVSVVLPDGTVESAACYNLPQRMLEGANPEYAKALLALAGRLGLPDDYLQQIRKQAV